MKIITTTALRKNVSKLLNAVTYRNQIIGIGRRNKIEALIIKYPENYNEGLDEMTNFNANSASFEFLAGEPDLYTRADLKKRYV